DGRPIPGGLRRSCGRLLPALERERPASDRAVYRSAEVGAVLDTMAAEMLSPERVRARDLFDPGEVQALVKRRSRARHQPRRAERLWSLLLVEAWCQAYLDRRGAAPAGRVPSARRQDESTPAVDPIARRRRSDASTLRGDLSPPAGA
ncbi:MAG TPA: asparagine synthase-related protein, partial [Gemmatimonadales bacterium]|nr:asparagine synthase-related protein [Gemmatimonadales bacterium]